MKEKTKEYLKLIVIGLALFAVVLYFKEIISMIGRLFGVFSPVFTGLLIAFVLNVPMKGIETFFNKLDKKGKCSLGFMRGLSIFLTFLILTVVFALVIILIVPNIISTTTNLVYLVQDELPVLIDKIQNKYKLDLSTLQNFLESLKLENLMEKAATMLSSMTVFVGATLAKMFNAGMAIIIACYVLAGKERLGNQVSRFLQAFMKKEHYSLLHHFCGLVNETYSNFLGGQCVESVIFALLITVSLAICQIPYAPMIGLLAGILSFIPYIGSLVACFTGAFFILIVNPLQAVFEIIVYQVVQFLEGQFIYPRIVGKSVGLPPLYTLCAALLGGRLFGLIGMIFFIPITSVLYTLVKELTLYMIQKKGAKELSDQ